jgi:hypothetical protein
LNDVIEKHGFLILQVCDVEDDLGSQKDASADSASETGPAAGGGAALSFVSDCSFTSTAADSCVAAALAGAEIRK